MVDINGYEIKSAFSGGEPLKAIYSLGEKVWPTDEPIPGPSKWGGLYFTALETGEICMSHYGTNEADTKPTLSYSKDGVNWKRWNYTPISVNKGDFICFKGINNEISYNKNENYSQFTSTGKIAASGNIMSLLYGDKYEGKLSLEYKSYCFAHLFHGCPIITAPELPATTLADSCYISMFYGCNLLTVAPELPSLDIKMNCYSSMFSYCSSLKSAPELPATSIAYGCYSGMFSYCGLTSAPKILPATFLQPYCYNNMFHGCNLLTTAPEIHALYLSEFCCASMFFSCSKLKYIKANFTDEPSRDYTYLWLSGVSSTGTFVANPIAKWTTSITRNETTVPAGWTIQK